MTTQLRPVDLTGSFADNLHGVLRDAADAGPLAVDEMTGATVVLRQRDLEVLAHDPRVNGIGLALFDVMGINDGPLRDWYGKLMFTNEGAYHRRMRSLVSRAFTPRSADRLRASASESAAEAMASVDGDGDLAAAVSKLAPRLKCRLLGVPEGDVETIAQWADALSPVFLFMTPDEISSATTALIALQDYVDELTRRRAADAEPGLITELLASEADGERLTHDEAVTMITNLLLAGHDTAGSQIPCSILVALQHRADLDGVLGDPLLLASAVSETIRLEPSIPLIPRTAVAPIELYDVEIPAGAMVFLCIASAGRDASVWENPDSFDPCRFTNTDGPRLPSFGAGAHYCLGAAVAKMAVETSVAAVLAHQPALRLTENPVDIPWRRILGRSPTRLLVTGG
jgi:cytochrome P450